MECLIVAQKLAFIEKLLCYILIFSVMAFVFNNELFAGFLKGLYGTKNSNSDIKGGE